LSYERHRILVLGGRGFIGRHAVSHLKRKSCGRLAVGTRAARPVQDQLEHLEIRFHERLHRDDWVDVASEFDVILNCVGILRPVGASTYDRVHHLAPKALAAACRRTNTRFIHVSALALNHPHRSRFLVSKRDGENAIIAQGGDWMIVRPSLLDGEGGFGAAWLRAVSRLPFFAAPMDARGRIAALAATDLGEALAKLCDWRSLDADDPSGRIFEFGGEICCDFETYLRGLRRRYTDTASLAVPVPGVLARAGAHLCDLFRFSPFSFGHWELLRKDNVPAPNRLGEVLGRCPEAVI